MLRSGKLCCALLLGSPWCRSASLDFAVSADLSSLSSAYLRFAADRRGNILIAGITRSCTLPTVRAVAACGSMWVGKLDPSGQKLLFATYLGGDNLVGVAADGAGNIVVAGSTERDNLLTVKALQPARKGDSDLYIVKLAGDGAGVIYATYLGGSSHDGVEGLAVDDQGAAYLLGTTFSLDFPTTPQSLPRSDSGTASVIAKLSPDGQSLAYASYLPFLYGRTSMSLDGANAVVLWADSIFLAKSAEIWRLAPDGSRLDRTPIVTRLHGPSVFSRSDGGFALAGSVVNGVLPVTSDALQPLSGASPYARVENGQAVRVALPGHQLYDFAVDRQDRNRIYAATDGGLFMSEDNGWTWRLLRAGPCFSIEVDPFDSNRLYLGEGTNAVLYRSTDRGGSWHALETGPPIGLNVTSIAADVNTPGLLYAAGGPLFRSSDAGDSWTSQWIGPSRQNMSPSASLSTRSSNVQVDPTHPGWAYVAGFSSCIGPCPVSSPILQTKDGGVSWNVVATLGPPPPYDFSSLDGSASVHIGPATGEVYVIHNGQLLGFRDGNFDTPQPFDLPSVATLAFDAETPGRVYAALGNPASLVRSDDGGATWTTIAHLDSVPGKLAVGAGGVLHASQTANAEDAYFLALDATGRIQYGTYVGGGATDMNAAAAMGGRVYLAGSTKAGLPAANAPQPDFGGGATDGFVAAFDDGGALLWSTYLGGSQDDSVDSVLPLPDGSVVVVGTTNSVDFPMLQTSPLGAGKTFIAHLRP